MSYSWFSYLNNDDGQKFGLCSEEKRTNNKIRKNIFQRDAHCDEYGMWYRFISFTWGLISGSSCDVSCSSDGGAKR